MVKSFNEYILEEIRNMFPQEEATQLTQRRVGDVLSHMRSVANSGDEDFLSKAREYGINLDSLKGEDESEIARKREELIQNQIKNGQKDLLEWVKKYLPDLRKCFKGNNFGYGFERTARDNGELKRNDSGEIEIDNNRAGSLGMRKTDKGNFSAIADNDTRENVLKLKDFLDKERLTFLFRKVPVIKSFGDRYGFNFKDSDVYKRLYDIGEKDENGNILNADETPWYKTPVDELPLDFSNISKKQIEAFYDGSRVTGLNAKIGVKSKDKFSYDSKEWGEIQKYAKEGKMYLAAKRYVERTYGMSFNFGGDNDMFKFGNNKINNDTLIVNFSSALRCPAWNECLLKDACYARTGEKNYDENLNKNLKKTFVWERTQTDPKLMDLMSQVIRSYFIRYDLLTRKAYMINRKKVTQDDLCAMTIQEMRDTYGQDFIDFVAKTKRGKVVRLNEDGDFIGQWLVDAWDKWAGDLAIIGIKVAAYTCRGLNYEKVKNIIINVSQQWITQGQNSSAFAHYFYAIEPEVYDKLEDTYSGENFGMEFDEDGKITPVYRSLKENGETVAYYYKCPCGRGKYRYEEININQLKGNNLANIKEFKYVPVDGRDDSAKYIKVGNKYFEKKENEGKDKKADCYRCRICYGRDSEGGILSDEPNRKVNLSKPVYVFVSAHGSDRIFYKANRTINGRSVSEWAKLQNNATSDANQLSESISNESQEYSDPMAIHIITRNAVESVSNMMRKNAPIMECKTKFYDIYNKIK